MRKLAILLLFVAGAAWAQTGAGVGLLPADVISAEDLDFTRASVHLAGPSAFYIRSVGIGGEQYSLNFAADSAGVWNLTAVSPESRNVLPPETILDFASITALDDTTLQIDGVFVDGNVYSGQLSVGDDAGLTLAGDIGGGNLEAINEARAEALADLILAEGEAAFEEALEEQRQRLQATIDELRTERDELQQQLAEAEEAATSTALDAGGAAATEGAETTRTSPLTDQQIADLLEERDILAGDLVGVAMENDQLRSQNKALSDQIATLQAENSRLQEEVTAMTSEVSRLTELLEAYRSGARTLPAEGGETGTESEESAAETAAGVETPAWTMPGDYLRKADLEAATAALTGELQSLEARVAGLESAATELAGLEEALRTGISGGFPRTSGVSAQPGELPSTATAAAPATGAIPPAPASAESATELAQIQAQLTELTRQNEELRREAQDLENRILEEIMSNGLVAMMSEQMTQIVQSGFSSSEPDVGSWEISRDRAIQSDSDAYFAKLALPARQGGEPILYSFRVRSLDDSGWVGVGLHLFVSDVEKRRGYGMGKSLLVWLTRDPDVYKNEFTYLQLYRSDDDVNMGRVMDAVVEEPLWTFIDVQVLYEPENQYITVAIDGEDKVRYRTWFGIDSGIEIALRTLGAAEFRDFRVQRAP